MSGPRGPLHQCRGKFPDFVALKSRLKEWMGPLFELSQDYPPSDPGTDAPWLTIDFHTLEGADEYILSLRDYAFADMIGADFRPEIAPAESGITCR